MMTSAEQSRKPVFRSVAEAKAALSGDRLGSVWYSAGKVFVATAHGTGNFLRAEWLAADGPRSSMEPIQERGDV